MDSPRIKRLPPRFALIENEHRARQAVRGIRKAFGGVAAPDIGALDG
jgi:hypothetical protein